jgi:hypothetical protein
MVKPSFMNLKIKGMMRITVILAISVMAANLFSQEMSRMDKINSSATDSIISLLKRTGIDVRIINFR